MSLIRVFENDDWVVDYETDSKTYRVSYFEDGHFVDQCRFEPYKEDGEDSIQRILNNAPNVTSLKSRYNAEDYTFEQIKNALDEFSRMTADLAKSDKEMYEEQAIKMLTNWDRD